MVRLKGGDPFVFGRGGEEVLACVAAGVTVTVVPGVSSALAAPAAAGIPLTHRGLAADFTVVSGHLDPGRPPEDGMDWDYLANGPSTLVLLMAMDRLDKIARELIARGRDPRTPAAAIENATLPQQRVVRAELSDLADAVAAAGLAAPAVVVIGAVVDALDGVECWSASAGSCYCRTDVRTSLRRVRWRETPSSRCSARTESGRCRPDSGAATTQRGGAGDSGQSDPGRGGDLDRRGRAVPAGSPGRAAHGGGAVRRSGPALGPTRPTNAWVLLAEVAPELADWASYFAAGASKRAAIESGATQVVTAARGRRPGAGRRRVPDDGRGLSRRVHRRAGKLDRSRPGRRHGVGAAG